MASTFRLDDARGDYLTLQEYCGWRGISERTLRRQLRNGTVYVLPCEEKPKLRWRVADCKRRRDSANVVRERQQRAKAQLQVAS